MKKLPLMTASTTATTTTIEDLHPDVLAAVLCRLDGAALASTSCATAHLRSISGDPSLWSRLCFSAFPSVSDDILNSLKPKNNDDSHRSFFSLAFPFPSVNHHTSSSDTNKVLPSRLISAVDVFQGESLIFSRIVETDTSSSWFHGSPFRIDALERKEDGEGVKNVTCSISPAEMSLSWVLIDPVNKDVVNISSRWPVAVEKHWYTGDTLVKFALAVDGGRCCVDALVVCGAGDQLKEVSLTVEDIEGVRMNGRDCLRVIEDLMESRRRGRDIEEETEEAKKRYQEFVKMKKEKKEKKASMEGRLDMLFASVGVSVFFAVFGLLLH